MKKYKIVFYISVSFLLVSCKYQPNELESTKIYIENNEYDFGEISKTDTITHTFKIKNITNNPLKIDKIGTSCGCTTTNYSMGLIEKNNFAIIETKFIPKKNQRGKVRKSIVVKCNIDSSFVNLYVKGFIKD